MHRWGVETELIQPFIPEVHILRFRGTRTLWGNPRTFRGDLTFGVYIRPHIKHDIVERIDEYLLTIGYRQYFWRGLHLELELDGGWAWGTNRFDGKEYSNPALLLSANIGYRFGFWEPGGLAGKDKRIGFYVVPQFGVLQGLWTDIGPRNGKTDTFLQGSLLVGLSL